MVGEKRLWKLDQGLCVLLMLLIPLQLCLSIANLFYGIDKGYGHSFPLWSYVLSAAYLCVVLSADGFMICVGRLELSKFVGRYWLSACGALAAAALLRLVPEGRGRSAPAGIHACPGVGSTAGNAGDRRDISDDGSRGHVLLVQLADLQVLCGEEIGWHRSGAKAPPYKQHPARLSAGRDACLYGQVRPGAEGINWPFPAEKSHGPARRR